MNLTLAILSVIGQVWLAVLYSDLPIDLLWSQRRLLRQMTTGHEGRNTIIWHWWILGQQTVTAVWQNVAGGRFRHSMEDLPSWAYSRFRLSGFKGRGAFKTLLYLFLCGRTFPKARSKRRVFHTDCCLKNLYIKCLIKYYNMAAKKPKCTVSINVHCVVSNDNRSF